MFSLDYFRYHSIFKRSEKNVTDLRKYLIQEAPTTKEDKEAQQNVYYMD